MKLSVSLPDADCQFLDNCVDNGSYASRSAVVARALRLLRTADLGKMYEEAFAEWRASEEFTDWESLDQSDWER